MNTPITNSHALDVYTNQGDGWVTEEKATDGEYVPSEISRRLELDRAALMKALDEIRRNPGDCCNETGFTSGHIAAAALTATRANFPTL